MKEVETSCVGDGSDGSERDTEEEELDVSEEEGRKWVGQAGLRGAEDVLHGTPSAEETQVETDRTGTRLSRKTLKRS